MNIVFSIYAILMLVGGYIGYSKAQSQMSLIMGIVSCVVIFLGVYFTKNSPQLGYGLISAMTALLVVSFLIRVIKTSSFMPSGMLLILSLIVLALAVKQLLPK